MRAACCAALAVAAASAAYSGPFTQLSPNALANVADPAEDFGPEDKLLACTDTEGDKLVFVDLENATVGSTVYTYRFGSQAWSQSPVVSLPCPEGGGLLPRDSGYTVGVTRGPAGDRLLILGGSVLDGNNLYFSDDCGQTWVCYDADQIWQGRDFAPIIYAPDVFPGSPVIMAGGRVEEQIFSVGMFLSYDLGITWQRPQCFATGNCKNALTTPDTLGACTATSGYYRHCYVLPDVPALPGSLAADWTNLYLFFEAEDVGGDGEVFVLNAGNFAIGWEKLPNAADAGGGRKVFIRGGVKGSGCWFSTDFLAEDLWVFRDEKVTSTNQFFTAQSAAGPWTDWSAVGVRAPWAPRAAAALTSSHASTAAYFASGMTFSQGRASAPTFGDVWQIDVGVCLLAPSNGKVCAGAGTPDLVGVTCSCAFGASGRFCETGKPQAANVAGAVLGTLAGLAVAAAGIVYFLPNWAIPGTRVVPADTIKDAAGAVVGAAKWAGGKVVGLFTGAGGASAGGGSSYAPVKSVATSSSPGGAYGGTATSSSYNAIGQA